MMLEAGITIDQGFIEKYFAQIPSHYATPHLLSIEDEDRPVDAQSWKSHISKQMIDYVCDEKGFCPIVYRKGILGIQLSFDEFSVSKGVPNEKTSNTIVKDFFTYYGVGLDPKNKTHNLLCTARKLIREGGIVFNEEENKRLLKPLMHAILEEGLLERRFFEMQRSRGVSIKVKLPPKDWYNYKDVKTMPIVDTLELMLAHCIRYEVCDKMLESLRIFSADTWNKF